MSHNAKTQPLMIAHAGGGINGQNYTNSLEALENSYAKGFRYFEIDFSWTSDEKIVCLHDWDKRFKKVFAYQTNKPLNYADFNHLLETTTYYHPCTPQSLAHWLIKHPDAQIITDVKYDNIKAIKFLIKTYPILVPHLIPQFYQPEEYQQLKQLGFQQLIWILYQYDGSYDSVIDESKNMNLFAISMRTSQAKKKFAKKLREKQQNIFIYTINDSKKMKKMISQFGVSGIYTDFLEI